MNIKKISKRYRKKPVVIEAVQFDGKNFSQIQMWSYDLAQPIYEHNSSPICIGMMIATKEGTMQAMPGDWIIKGVEGEFYPCKPSIFSKTYEPVKK